MDKKVLIIMIAGWSLAIAAKAYELYRNKKELENIQEMSERINELFEENNFPYRYSYEGEIK